MVLRHYYGCLNTTATEYMADGDYPEKALYQYKLSMTEDKGVIELSVWLPC